jgi:hypothetical protein
MPLFVILDLLDSDRRLLGPSWRATRHGGRNDASSPRCYRLLDEAT